MYPRLTVSRHPMIQHFIALMRDEECASAQFRFLVNQLAILLTYEALAAIPLPVFEIKDRKTPSSDTYEGQFIDSSQITLLALMRTAMTMASSVHPLLPGVSIGHAGFKRSRDADFLEPFYLEVPEDLSRKTIIIYDTGLVTGASVASLLRLILQERSANPERIAIVSIIVCDEALHRLDRLFGQLRIPIFTAAHDPGFRADEKAYFARPGVGSFQKRMFGFESPVELKYPAENSDG